MSRVNYGSFLLGLFGFAISHSITVTATHVAGVSAVTVQDQSVTSSSSFHSSYYHKLRIENWVTPTNQSLFIDGELKDNSTFLVATSGIYYVTSNIRIEVSKRRQFGWHWHYWHYYSSSIFGQVHLEDLQYSRVTSNMDITSDLQLKSSSSEKLNMKISGYLFLQAGWQVSIEITTSQRDITIKAGSTLSLLYTSKPFAFPGIQIHSKSQHIELKYPNFSEFLQWMKPEDSSTMLSTAENFVAPLNGLYHVVANIGFRRRTDVVYKFAIHVNNTVEVLSKTTSLSSQDLTTITLEGVLNLFKNQAISISISSNGQYANVQTYFQESSLSICYKGKLSNSRPVLSASFKDNNKRMPANTWNRVSEWNLNAKPSLHFGNNEFLSDLFVIPKSGFYYVSLVISISDCDEAMTKLNVKQSLTGTVNSVGPGFHLTAENTTCNIDISLILQLNINDTLSVYVLSDKTFTVEPTTTLQILYHNEFHLWPAARFTVRNSVSFSNNKPPTKVTGWSPSASGHPMFFTINEDNIEIRVPGLYIVVCTLVLKRAPQFWGQFESQLTVNGKMTMNDIKCRKINTTSTFTCVMSTLLSLVEKDFLTVLIKTSDQSGSKKESISLLHLSSVSVVLVGDTRSRPSFRVAVYNKCNKNTPYTTKAKTTFQKSCLPELSNTANTFFSSAGLYSLSNNSFETGSQKAFFIQSSMQFKLLSDGQVSSVIGSNGRNVYAYSQEQTKGLTSVLASAITFDSPYNINISGQAFSSDFKWEIQPGSIVSGIYIGDSESLTAFQAVMPDIKTSANCSSEWKRIPHWTQLLGKDNPQTFTDNKGFKVSQDGLFFVSLNFVIKTNVPGNDVHLGVFLDNTKVLFASETSRKGPNYISILLQGVVTLYVNQVMEVRIKCSSSFNFTYSGYTLSGFRVDEDPTMPGIHWELSPNYSLHSSTRIFYPFWYNRYQQNNKNYATDINYNTSTSEMSVSRTGIYFVSLTGELNDLEESDFIFSIGNSSSTSCLHSSPIFFKKSNNFVRSVSTNGLVFLRKDEDFALIDLPGSYHKSYWYHGYHYHYSHYSSVYLSLHYIGDVEISSGISSILSSSKHLPESAKLKLIDTNWVAKSMCGMFSTADVAVKFEKFKAVYSSIHMVTVSLMLTIKKKCHVTVCAVVTGRSKDRYQSCFEHHIANDTKNTSTVGGSVLLYLEKGEQVGIKVNNTCALTVSNRSSLSVIELGRNSLFGFSTMIETAKANLSFVFPNTNRYYYSFRDRDTTTHNVQGWTTDAKNLKMAMFNRGIPSPLNEMFVCSKTGVYLILVKLHIKAVRKVLRQVHDCVVGAKLAVNSEDIDIGVQQLFSGATNTLSFTTTMMLKKWQAMTVRFTNRYEQCGEMEIGHGSTFAAIYLASPAVESHIMPSDTIPQIVQIPPPEVYFRVDKASSISELTCKAVGEFSLKYKWVNDNKKVINNHTTLDPRKLINSNNTRVACVVTMGTVVSQSSFILVKFFDPNLQFMEMYSNMTYYIEEKNETQYSSHTIIVPIVVRERMPYVTYHWYWYWNNPIRCFILNGDYDGIFHLQKKYFYSYDYSEVYELNAQNDMIDHEKRTEYNLTISCTNTKYKDVANVTTTVHVVVLDINDNLPVFEQDIYNVTIPRNIRPGEDIIQVMATDDDFAQNGKIRYKLMETSNSFVIDSFSGVISLSSSGHGLSTKPFYILTVEATDHGIPPRSSTAVVIVVIGKLRRTNNHPVFDKSEYTTYLIKLAPIGSLVEIVHAYDPDTLDEETVVYSIYSGDDKTFEINPRTGLITTKAKLSPKTYELQIAAEYSDKPLKRLSYGQDRNITTVVIVVEDVDVTRPNFLKPHYIITVKEDVEIKHLVLKIKAIDANLPKQSHLNYSIPSPQEAFVIDSRSGEIRTAANLDYETRKHYAFVVSVSRVPDTLQSSCTDVTINVQDVNDNAPIILFAPETIHVHENIPIGTYIGNVTATDYDQGDNGKIKYYLDRDPDYFQIDPDTGKITTRGMLDCCDVVYVLSVEVKDEGIPPLNVSIDIEIDVIPNGNPHHSTAHPRGHPKGSSSKKIIIIASSCGAVFVLFFIFAAIYCKRRQRHQNLASTTMNYITLPLDEEDDELLDPAAGDESERRLSLISQTSQVSAGSQNNLIPTEVQC